jgi:hypothetical protein
MTDQPSNDNARMANAERDIEHLRNDIKGLHEKSDTIIKSLAEMSQHYAVEDAYKKANIKSIESRLCPKPGACIDLTPRVEALEKQFSAWHDAQQQFKGALKTVRTFWLGVGALLTTLGWFAKEFLTRN